MIRINTRYLIFASLGFEIAATIAGSIYVGYLLDEYLGLIPVFTLLFLIGGGVGSFLFILRAKKTFERQL